MRERKKAYAEVARLYGKNESYSREVINNNNNNRATFTVAPQTANVTDMARDQVLMKVEKALNFWVGDTNRRRVPVDATCYGKKP